MSAFVPSSIKTESATTPPALLSRAIKAEAAQLGFDLVGIAPAVAPQSLAEFREWLERGFAGEMEYLSRRETAYETPYAVLESVRSIVILGLNYRTEEPAAASGHAKALVARYAWGDADYHDVIRRKLRQLGDFLHQQRPGCRTRGVVDTAPLLERDFARLAGLGWFGKNTMLINKQAGSWFFLAALLVDVELHADDPHDTSHCGTCTRCLDACPTDAFPEPYVLDARKCISYLTIELRGPVPLSLREPMGDWLFGCDICQDVCPWNRKAPRTEEPAFAPRAGMNRVDASSLLQMSEGEFQERFGETALARPGRGGLLRNAAIVLGNSNDTLAVPPLVEALDDSDPLVRGAVAWALGRLGSETAAAALQSRAAVEDNADVQQELAAALEHFRRSEKR
jgi:epoxyqueuosine reductase